MITSRDWLWLLVAAATIINVAWLTLPANAAECLPSAAAVREAHGIKTWSSYSRHVAGHDGQLCYYANKKERQVMQGADDLLRSSGRGGRRSNKQTVVIRPVSATPAAFDKEAEFRKLERMAEQILWRHGFNARVKEWFAIYNKAPCVEDDNGRVFTFNERFSGAVPARKVQSVFAVRPYSVSRL